MHLCLLSVVCIKSERGNWITVYVYNYAHSALCIVQWICLMNPYAAQLWICSWFFFRHGLGSLGMRLIVDIKFTTFICGLDSRTRHWVSQLCLLRWRVWMKLALRYHSMTSPQRDCRTWTGDGLRRQQWLWSNAGEKGFECWILENNFTMLMIDCGKESSNIHMSDTFGFFLIAVNCRAFSLMKRSFFKSVRTGCSS